VLSIAFEKTQGFSTTVELLLLQLETIVPKDIIK
jgi:hypothetical protein